MGDPMYAVQAEPLDAAKARAALQQLRVECDKFIGTGIQALQVAGVVGATPSEHLRKHGIPTWETTIVQLTLLIAAAIVLPIGRLSHPVAPEQGAATG